MPITRTTMIDDDGSGTTGTILNNAWLQTIYGQIDSHVSDWIDVPFSAANFAGASPMTWTVGAAAVRRNRYAVHSKMLVWSMYLSWFSGSNVLGGSPASALKLTAPSGITVAPFQEQILDYCAGIAGAPQVAGLHVATDTASPVITVYKSAGGNFALSDIPGLVFTIALEVV